MEPSRIDFGSRFKQEREARHLSLGDVARVTKIPERSLERLEGGRFDELPAEVFVRGFVRSYARAVGLDPDEMARRYGEIVQTDAPPIEVSLAGAVRAAAQRAVTQAAGKPNPESGIGMGATPVPRATTMGPVPRVATSKPAAARLPSAPAVSAVDEPRALATIEAAPIDHEAAAEATVAETFVDEGIVVVHKAPTKAARKDPSHTDEMRTLSKAILDAGRETRRLPLTLAVIILVIVATLTMSLLLSRPNHIGDGITRNVAAAAPTRA
jgi:hypothetical protein